MIHVFERMWELIVFQSLSFGVKTNQSGSPTSTTVNQWLRICGFDIYFRYHDCSVNHLSILGLNSIAYALIAEWFMVNHLLFSSVILSWVHKPVFEFSNSSHKQARESFIIDFFYQNMANWAMAIIKANQLSKTGFLEDLYGIYRRNILSWILMLTFKSKWMVKCSLRQRKIYQLLGVSIKLMCWEKNASL